MTRRQIVLAFVGPPFTAGFAALIASLNPPLVHWAYLLRIGGGIGVFFSLFVGWRLIVTSKPEDPPVPKSTGFSAVGCGTAISLGEGAEIDSEDLIAVGTPKLLDAGKGAKAKLRRTYHEAPGANPGSPHVAHASSGMSLWTDEALISAYRRTITQLGDPEKSVLLAEIERRNLKL